MTAQAHLRAADSQPASRHGDILATAARLFRDHGYARTTMTRIARECGLGQSSLYYWFPQKGSILLGLLALNRGALDFADSDAGVASSPAVRLLRLLRFDLSELCRSPLDICEIELLAEQQPEVFSEFWTDTAALHRLLATLITDGVAAGEFAPCDPELAALSICAAEQGVQHRYRHSAAHAPGGTSPFRHPQYSREQLAEEVAGMLVRGLLRDPGQLTALRSAAGDA